MPRTEHLKQEDVDPEQCALRGGQEHSEHSAGFGLFSCLFKFENNASESPPVPGSLLPVLFQVVPRQIPCKTSYPGFSPRDHTPS